ncbi:MAG: NAD(P)H-binding protein [Leptospiraceae bacterium]|nr:NAD(P)H-binding protein [Leptospiraceae bacterium]
MEKINVLVTGASGFLGGETIAALQKRSNVQIVAAVRDPHRMRNGQSSIELRVGDLTDAEYRKSVVQGIDVICHTGTWGSFWGHAALERSLFLEPAKDLINQAMDAGVKRFILAGTVAAAAPGSDPIADNASMVYTGFWPHLDRIIDLDGYMRANSRHMQMIHMRLGHFVGAKNDLGMVPALLPRLKTRLVPYLAGGRSRLPLIADSDLGESFALAALAEGLEEYESINIVSPEHPSMREVLEFIHEETGIPKPWFSVPYFTGYVFGWLMEKLAIIPDATPFLTRSLVYVAEERICSTEYASEKLGFVAAKSWKEAVRETIKVRAPLGFPSPRLTQLERAR